jgi:hypothetical protein
MKGYNAKITVDAFDWQNDIGEVSFYCPAITGDSLNIMSKEDADTWSLNLINNTAAQAGDYSAYIIARTSIFDPVATYKEISISIEHAEKEGWAVGWGGPAFSNDIAIDHSGNIYVVGNF